MHKLGVVVPYRNRDVQLRRFLRVVPVYLKQQGIDYEIIIAEQMDEESFNRGALLNAGALQAIELGCDYLVFHDVDLIPRYVDYSYSEVPVELVGKVINDSFEEGFKINLKEKGITEDYFGGAVLFPVDLFKKVNGYSNRYEGWGFEDNDLLERCKEKYIPLKSLSKKQYFNLEPAFTFNGKNSYVECPVGKLDPNKSLSFLVTFRVNDLPFKDRKISDEGCIFCIPGLDLNLSYTNFGTYKFEVFDSAENSYSIHTDKLPVGITSQAVIVFEDGKVTFYLNGVKVGHKKCIEDYRFVTKSQKLYLGTTDPVRKYEAKWLDGQVSEIAVFRKALTQIEISELFSQSFMGFGKHNPTFWYSAKVLDEVFAKNLGSVEDLTAFFNNTCTIEPLVSLRDTYSWIVPWNRGGTFKCLPHRANGSEDGSWRSWNTRMNQQRFQEVEKYGTFKSSDGLSTIPVIAKSVIEQEANYWHVQVFFNRSIKKLR